MILKIIGSDTPYEVSPKPFTSQHGYKGIRFVGDEIPSTDKGFMLYDDDGAEVADYSAYKYEYGQNEYTVTEDIREYPEGNNEPIQPSSIDRLNSKVNRLSSQVAEITPYTDTKTAYYGEREKVFYNAPTGNTSVFFSNYNGSYTVERVADMLMVSFEPLTESTEITISIQ